MPNPHSHRAIKGKAKDVGWSHCVIDRWHAGVEHGNIITHDTCSCGATRESESNAGRTAYGPWRGQRGQGA
jgi:hypothetical protein